MPDQPGFPSPPLQPHSERRHPGGGGADDDDELRLRQDPAQPRQPALRAGAALLAGPCAGPSRQGFPVAARPLAVAGPDRQPAAFAGHRGFAPTGSSSSACCWPFPCRRPARRGALPAPRARPVGPCWPPTCAARGRVAGSPCGLPGFLLATALTAGAPPGANLRAFPPSTSPSSPRCCTCSCALRPGPAQQDPRSWPTPITSCASRRNAPSGCSQHPAGADRRPPQGQRGHPSPTATRRWW